LGQDTKRDDDGKRSHFNPFLAKQTGHEMLMLADVTHVCNNFNNLAKSFGKIGSRNSNRRWRKPRRWRRETGARRTPYLHTWAEPEVNAGAT
jgi:hypothetical protein